MNEGQAKELDKKYSDLDYSALHVVLLKYNKEDSKSILIALFELILENREPVVVDYDPVAVLYSVRYGDLIFFLSCCTGNFTLDW